MASRVVLSSTVSYWGQILWMEETVASDMLVAISQTITQHFREMQSC
jgi:hypothetical protein